MTVVINRDGIYPISQPNKTPQASAVPPTKAGQIPVSRINTVTGQVEYFPEDDPLFTINPATDAGKALTITTDQVTGKVTFTAEDFIAKDDAVKALINQTGVITVPEITKTPNTTNSISVTAFKAVFYDKATDQLTTIDVPAQNIIITGANSADPTKDITYLKLLPNGNFVQETTQPTSQQIIEEQYICEILHENGGPINSIRPLLTIYSNLQKQNRQVFETIGLNDKDFVFTFTRATGAINQTSARARIIGYLITTVGNNPNEVTYPVANAITVDYFSFDPNERLNNINNFLRTYKVDDPNTATSTVIANNEFGILALFASISGSYTIIASQKKYTSLNDAETDRMLYLSRLVLPTDFGRNNVLVASIIVSGTVSTNTNTEFLIALSGDLTFNGGGSVAPSGLPDPASAQAGDVVVVNPTTSGYEFQASKVNYVAPAPVGSILVSDGTKFQPTPIQSINQNTFGLFAGLRNLFFVKFIWDTSSNVTTTTKMDPNSLFIKATLNFVVSEIIIDAQVSLQTKVQPIIAYLVPITDASTVDNFVFCIHRWYNDASQRYSTMNLSGGNVNLQKNGKAYELILFFYKYA